MNNKNNSVFYCTNQVWKLWATYVVDFVAILLIVVTELNSDSLSPIYYVSLMLFGAFILLSSFVFACIAIKCPGCEARWYWLALRKKQFGNALSWLYSQSTCTVCGISCQDLNKKMMGKK